MPAAFTQGKQDLLWLNRSGLTPGVGVYLADSKRTNMENYGVQPDIRVDNAPEDNLAGRDRQLETAVEELLRQLGSSKRNIASKEEQ